MKIAFSWGSWDHETWQQAFSGISLGLLSFLILILPTKTPLTAKHSPVIRTPETTESFSNRQDEEFKARSLPFRSIVSPVDVADEHSQGMGLAVNQAPSGRDTDLLVELGHLRNQMRAEAMHSSIMAESTQEFSPNHLLFDSINRSSLVRRSQRAIQAYKMQYHFPVLFEASLVDKAGLCGIGPRQKALAFASSLPDVRVVFPGLP